jgi:hypothetical protein
MARTRLFIASLFSFLVSTGVFAQAGRPETDIFNYVTGSDNLFGTIAIKQDARLREMVRKYAYGEQKTEGYRIQIYSDSGPNARQRANNLKEKFKEEHEETAVYYTYETPFHKLRVGDFRNRIDAFAFYKEIQEEFPDAFLVKDNINTISEGGK